MSEHRAVVDWRLSEGDFLKGRFSREHTWSFDGGLTVSGSASPAVVPPPYSNPASIDPEEAFVASLASCHMLTFLFLAYRQKFDIVSYRDEAVGEVSKNEQGRSWVSLVTLNPEVVYAGDRQPTREEEQQLHHVAHEQCFISNSVKTEVKVNLS